MRFLARRLPETRAPWRAAACLACGAFAFGGCDKNPAAAPPAAGFDAAALDSDLALVNRAFAAPAIGSLAALDPLLTVAAAPPATAPAALRAACAPAERASAAAPPGAALRVAGLIPDSLYRRVFAYDTAARAYRVGADTSGPAGGVRFVLYDLNAYALPALPLSPDGSLDLVDQSAGATLSLRAQITSGATAVAEYVAGLSGTQAADTARLAGTVGGGAPRLLFADTTAGAGFTVVVAAHLTDSLTGLRVDMRASRVSFDPFDYNDDLDIAFTTAAQTIRATGAIRTYCLLPSIGLTVAVDGAAYASVTNGAGTTPAVTRADGQPVPAAEAQAILDLRDTQQRLFSWLVAFVTPAKGLLPRN